MIVGAWFGKRKVLHEGIVDVTSLYAFALANMHFC